MVTKQIGKRWSWCKTKEESKVTRKQPQQQKPTRIGQMTGSRGTWENGNGVTKVVPDKKNSYSRKTKHKGRSDY